MQFKQLLASNFLNNIKWNSTLFCYVHGIIQNKTAQHHNQKLFYFVYCKQ